MATATQNRPPSVADGKRGRRLRRRRIWPLVLIGVLVLTVRYGMPVLSTRTYRLA